MRECGEIISGIKNTGGGCADWYDWWETKGDLKPVGGIYQTMKQVLHEWSEHQFSLALILYRPY